MAGNFCLMQRFNPIPTERNQTTWRPAAQGRLPVSFSLAPLVFPAKQEPSSRLHPKQTAFAERLSEWLEKCER